MTRPLARRILLILALFAISTSARAVALIVRASPAGAMASAEGKTLPTPATFDFKRRDEPYVITVTKPGFQSETLTFQTRQKIKELSVTLEPLTLEKEISIKSTPDGATVTIDGKTAGTTPFAKPVTFTRTDKSSPWQPLPVVISKTDYQSESFRLTAEAAPAPVTLAQLRIERNFLVSTKTAENAAIEAVLTLGEKELGTAPQKIPVVFSRSDKTKPWPTFTLKAEIPTLYQPVTVTLAQDSFDNIALTLKPITELPVARYAPAIEMTPTGAKLTVDQGTRVGLIDKAERGADISGLAPLTRFDRRDRNVKAPLQALNSYAITPDGQSAILSVTQQDESNGKFYSGLFLKRVEDDGGGTARLIDNNKRYFDCAPIIAPDSSNILVFQSNRGDLNKPDVFRISFTDNRTSGGVSRITADQRFNFSPSYTDSNREVVYLSIEPNYPLAQPQLSSVKMDGALPTQFQINAEEVSHREPTKIYLTRPDQSNGKRQIYSVEPDGRLETNIISDDTFLNANCFNPVASYTNPVRILFVSDRDKDDAGRPNNNIYVMNADGSAIQQLTANGSDDIMPAWSPTDPSVVYFLSNRGGAYNLWRLRIK
ncbi:MAG TPA: PEGA domain-containing protein [Lacunisphaera sp.]|nr:PEGA domain-containing protein [Lacunisphaera sp.]